MRETDTAGIVWINGEAFAPNHPKAKVHRQPVGGLDGPKSEQGQRRESKASGMVGIEASVGCVITLTSYRRRLLDGHDNLMAAHKPLVDRITEDLGFSSDNDTRIKWEYQQIVTRGATGTSVVISQI